MTASTVKSVNLTNITATPITVLDKLRGVKKTVIDKIAVATTSTDDVGDIIMLGPIPSNAKILSIKLFNDDLDSNGAPTLAADVGLYYSGIGNVVSGVAKTSGTVVSATCIGTAITTLQAANTTGVEIRFKAGDIVDIVKEAWELGGLTADCGGLLNLGLTITTAAATGAAGDVVVVIDYLV